MCFGPRFVFGDGFFFYSASAVKFDIAYTLPVPPNIRRCARNFVRFFIVYGAPPPFLRGLPGSMRIVHPKPTSAEKHAPLF